jgi:hypothetical protein
MIAWRWPRVLMASLLLAVALAAWRAPWHSTMSIDDRTYFEMIDGISRHGLPWHDNGPADRFVELRARWNQWHDGRLWGSLATLYPYLAAPLYRLGGVRAVIVGNFALLALLALGAHRLAHALTGKEVVAMAAAFAVLLCTPTWTGALVTTSYTLVITCTMWALDAAVRAADDARAWGRAALAGLLAGVATGAHPLCGPILAGLVIALALVPPRAPSLALAALAGSAPPLAWVAWVNHLRFGTWNPITYGPQKWRQSIDAQLDRQEVGAMLLHAAPLLGWAALAALLAFALRRAPRARVAAALLLVGALFVPSPLRVAALSIGGCAWGFFVDTSALTLDGYWQTPDHLGHFMGPFVVKAMLQSTPALALAPLARFTGAAARRRALVVALPCVLQLAALPFRAGMPTAFAIGYPFLHQRYVMASAAPLLVLALAAVAALRWRPNDGLLVAVTALVGIAILVRSPDDVPLERRVLLLRGSLLVGAAALLLVALQRRHADARRERAAVKAAAVAFGLSAAISLAVDLRALLAVRAHCDQQLDAVLAHVPPSLALIGGPGEIDPVLALEATRDVQYADLYELRDWTRVRPLVDTWMARGRPVFGLFPATALPACPWPDLRFDVVVADVGLVRIARR